MKILFETDIHFKEIGPHANESRYNPKYSTRLDQCVKSYEWFYDLARTLGVDMIVHGGDVVDKPLILAKESHAIKDAFSCNTTNIPEYILIGNHDRKDSTSHALAILGNYPNIKIVDKPLKLDEVSFLPFATEVDESVYAELSNKILFSHVDILGTQFAEHIFSSKGADPEVLKKYFKIVYNGHLHNPSNYGIVYNLGAFMGSGFGDIYDKYYPSAFLIDTEVLGAKAFVNPHAIHYENIKSNNIVEIKNQIEALIKEDFKFYLRVQCSNELKKSVRELVDFYLGQSNNILSAIVIGTVRKTQDLSIDVAEFSKAIQVAANPIDAILGFAKITPKDKLPVSLDELQQFIMSEYTIGDQNV